MGAGATGRLRAWLAGATLLAAAVALLRVFGQHTPIKDWVAWVYLEGALAALVFGVASLGVGHRVVQALSPHRRVPGHYTLAFATGVLCSFYAIFSLGLLGLLRTATFFVLPAALLALGLPSLLRAIREDLEGQRLDLSPVTAVVLSVGVVGLVAAYLPILNPGNIAYDARWYHLGLAENYAARGAIRASPDGVLANAIPHLPSVLYAWAFLAPASLFTKVQICAHLEALVFLGTLPGITALVRELLPESRVRLAWVAIFLWPSVLVYDSSLVTAGDHIATCWTVPVYLTALRLWRLPTRAHAWLFALSVAGLALSKYTGLIAYVPIVVVVLARLAFLSLRQPAARGALGHVLLAGVLLTTPHWLKNLVFYGDPVYPTFARVLPVHPWTADSAARYTQFQATNFAATGPWAGRLWGAVRAMMDHSFSLYNWEMMHGKTPVFGSLFTFSLPALLFVPPRRRLLGLVATIHVGVGLWYILSHQERYLQVLLPLMVASTVALGVLVARLGSVARLGVIALAGVQAIWTCGAIFFPIHRMAGGSGLSSAVEYLAGGYPPGRAGRLRPYADYEIVGEDLPNGSRLLLHQVHLHLGFGHETLSDSIPLSMGISYGRLGGVPGAKTMLQQMGVTHLVHQRKNGGEDSLAGDIVFWSTVARGTTVQRGAWDRIEVASIDDGLPGDAVFVKRCVAGWPASGWYALGALATEGGAPSQPEDARGWAEAAYVVTDPHCLKDPDFTQRFMKATDHGAMGVWVRKR